jgi:hypothetical protein
MKFFAFVCVLVIGLSFVVMCSADLPFIQYQNFGGASFPDISIVHQFEANIVQYETMGELLLDIPIEHPIKIYIDEQKEIKFDFYSSMDQTIIPSNLSLCGYAIRCLQNPEIMGLLTLYFENCSNETYRKHIVVCPENLKQDAHVSLHEYARYDRAYVFICNLYLSDEEAQQNFMTYGICFNQWVLKLYSLV